MVSQSQVDTILMDVERLEMKSPGRRSLGLGLMVASSCRVSTYIPRGLVISSSPKSCSGSSQCSTVARLLSVRCVVLDSIVDRDANTPSLLMRPSSL